MAIVTQAQVKTAVGIAGTDYDTQITALIPYVQQFIIDYCKNDFRENGIYVQSNNMAFTKGTGATHDTITDSDSQFSDDYAPVAGDHIVVDGSFRNNGRVYQIAAAGVAAGTLTLESIGDTVAEDLAGKDSVKLTLVVFSPELQHIAAELINYHLMKGNTVGTKDDGGAVDPLETYPAEHDRDFKKVLNRLVKYRKVFS